jgi:hypothetical protein
VSPRTGVFILTFILLAVLAGFVFIYLGLQDLNLQHLNAPQGTD